MEDLRLPSSLVKNAILSFVLFKSRSTNSFCTEITKVATEQESNPIPKRVATLEAKAKPDLCTEFMVIFGILTIGIEKEFNK